MEKKWRRALFCYNNRVKIQQDREVGKSLIDASDLPIIASDYLNDNTM
jgi:hypothetical protein